jgi:DNA replication and repair protein RecF
MQALLHLDSLSLVQFKNYVSKPFLFADRITGICGSNGAGKTNILDAIYYLCLTKSYFGKTDSAAVSFGYQGFRIDGQFNIKGNTFQTVCVLRENGKKENFYDSIYSI